MAYESLYCHICEGYVRGEFVSLGQRSPLVTHNNLEDCVKELADRIKKLEDSDASKRKGE